MPMERQETMASTISPTSSTQVGMAPSQQKAGSPIETSHGDPRVTVMPDVAGKANTAGNIKRSANAKQTVADPDTNQSKEEANKRPV